MRTVKDPFKMGNARKPESTAWAPRRALSEVGLKEPDDRFLRYHEVKRKETQERRGAAEAGLATKKEPKSIGIPCKKRSQDKRVYPATAFSRCRSDIEAPSGRGAGRAGAQGPAPRGARESLLP